MDLTQDFHDLEVLTYHGEPLMPSQTPGRLRKILVRVTALMKMFAGDDISDFKGKAILIKPTAKSQAKTVGMWPACEGAAGPT
jgi:hypothetical protein